MSRSGKTTTISTQEKSKINRVVLGVMSSEEIEKMGVAEIFHTNIYSNYSPNQNALNDPRMGVSDVRSRCMSCEGTIETCPGHFGYIKLARPVYHTGYLDIVKKILTCVCRKCSKLMIYNNEEDYEKIRLIKDGRKRLNECEKACKKKRVCGLQRRGAGEQKDENDGELAPIVYGCGETVPTYMREKLGLTVRFQSGKSDEQEGDGGGLRLDLKALEVLEIFKKVSDADVAFMGLDPKTSRPENLIFTILPVVPPPVRPSILMDSVSRSEDDLTHQYTQILKVNNELRNSEKVTMGETQIEEKVKNLQHLVATLMNNEINGLEQSKTKSGKPIKSIRERLRGKEGRLRKNLMGKRVDFSARTVVSPDPNLALDELGVPRSVALNLTIPETVTSLNIERLKKLVATGPTEWPGAKILRFVDGREFDLRYTQNRDNIELDVGYVVERHLVDGDLVVFNRQPTLHRMSMMGHKIKILPYSSFRLNLSVTTPYNADFDGDEMNMHVPQTYESKAEIKEIMHVPKQIISPQSNKPVMGIVQDSLVGIRLMTKRNSFLRKDQVMQLLLWLGDFNYELPQPAILKPVPLWTGKQIISLLLPEVNITKNCSVHNKEDDEKSILPIRDTKILIEKGELLMGMLDKGVVGSSSGGIIHCIYLDYGPDKAASFLTYTQKIVNNWIVMHGFTVGCSDIFPDEATQQKVESLMNKAGDILDSKFLEAERGNLKHQPGKRIFDSFEAIINQELNNVFKEASQEAQNMMTDRNNIYNMVASGSKGSGMNIAQIMGCVGQQNVEGKRIPYGFKRRTLPHFCKEDYGRDSKGFVRNSYFTGLKPDEFFFHAMGGREGLIDTAVKTSETGYVQRKLVKALEDIMVKYDSTVRDCGGNIIQFLYGEDGMAGEFIEGFLQNFVEMNNETLKKEFLMFDSSDNEGDFTEQLNEAERYFESNIIADLLNNRDLLPLLNEEFERIKNYRDEIRKIFPNFENQIHLPVNIPRLIRNCKANSRNKFSQSLGSQRSRINPIDVINEVDNLINKKLMISIGSDPISIETQRNGIFLLTIMIRTHLSSKKVCYKECLTPDVFKEIIGEIEFKFNKAKVHPGEMVGVICAQSLGEPTTQMTLNTFHHAGISSKNVTLGVPRLKEILNIGKNIKTPSMQVHVLPEIKANLDLLKIKKEAEINSKIKELQSRLGIQDVNELPEIVALKKEIEYEQNSKIKELQSKLEYTTLKDLTIVSEIYYDPDPENTIIEEDKDLISSYYQVLEFENQTFSSWVLRFFLDKTSLIERGINSLREIKDRIDAYFPDKLQIIYDAVYQPDMPVIRIRRKLGENEGENMDSQEQLKILRNLEHEFLNTVRLKGIHNVNKVYLKPSKKHEINLTDGSIKIKDNDLVFDTDGSNLKEVFSLDFVDFRKTITNNCFEMKEVLGIEAARLSLLKEIRAVLETYSIYVNYRHLTTLCDIMTQRGELTSISRHGINRVVDGPFRRASFEQTVEILLSAGVFSEVQRFYGISENIMFGQLCPLGTGSFKLVLDTEFVKNNEPRYMPDTNIAIINHQQTMENMDSPSGGYDSKTPEHRGTPRYDPSNTPIASTRTVGHDIAFTPDTPNPNRGVLYNPSPIYRSGSMMESVSPGQSQRPFLSPYYSPAYPNNSPIYSPNSSSGSPRYSPKVGGITGMQYSPTSPSYENSSVSPSYSSGAGRTYGSPSSPVYRNSLSTPQQNYSPASPNYTGTPLSSHQGNTPSSQNLGTNYSPNSPAYNLTNLTYNPTSPVYDPSNARGAKPIQEEYSAEEDDDNDEDDEENEENEEK